MDWKFLNCSYLSLNLIRCKNVKSFGEQTTHAKLHYKFCGECDKTKKSRIECKIFLKCVLILMVAQFCMSSY